MPELAWSWGYPSHCRESLLSAVLPAACSWFKWARRLCKEKDDSAVQSPYAIRYSGDGGPSPPKPFIFSRAGNVKTPDRPSMSR